MSDVFWRLDSPRRMARQAAEVELKVVVPSQGDASAGIATGRGPSRTIYFLDTDDLRLYRQGVIVRFRSRPHRRDDAVVKLRPFAPGNLPGRLRAADGFHIEIDALPGNAICSGALKQRLGCGEVAATLAAGRPLTSLLSRPQRKLLAAHHGKSELTVYGPIDVRLSNVKLRGLKRELTAERWRYPDGSDLLELSTRCSVGEAAAVAARVSAALRSYGVFPAENQRTKTDVALLA